MALLAKWVPMRRHESMTTARDSAEGAGKSPEPNGIKVTAAQPTNVNDATSQAVLNSIRAGIYYLWMTEGRW